ncbi:hypothetical protein [Acidianus sp. HS-5]|uniref:hypothetical protein n=1 Tax=Acidianus sp. HS-5 TaxID=2886040 RepID=UPI001F2E3F84|nr:hypothetical protein [Acidianus sp. HS-5]BDC17520.1 hypothetical protein HS5_04100 [Acidianus sp. HS-5]
MSGKIDEILNNPQLLSALADKIYEKLKDELVIKKLEENSASIKALQEEIKRQGEAITSLQEAVKKQGEAIASLQEEVKKHGEAITSLQEAVKSLQEEVKKHGEAITSLQEAVKKQGEAIEALQKAVLKLSREVKKLSMEVGSFTNRAGKGMEKTMLKLYKKALELHGVDPSKVMHGMIVDESGVIEKGRSFEVDFYDTDDFVYVFEIKNLADRGAYDQIIIRKKLFSAKYKDKKIRIFLVANFIDKGVKRKLEKEGIEIIASHVVE